MRLNRFIILLLALCVTGQVRASVDDAVQAYLRGEFNKAAVLLRPEAEKGDPQAQTYMGVLYERGKGVPKDYAESVKWYRLAAEQGKADAQYYLANMYRRGDGVSQDAAEALSWYTRAADQGKAAAQYALGDMYAKGEGGGKDYVKAYMWFNIAAISGNEPYVKRRDEIGKKMDKAELEQAQKLSREWIDVHPK